MSTVTTYLEMTSQTQLRPAVCTDPKFSISEETGGDWHLNKALYQRVGSSWRWTDKLTWTDEQWQAYAASPKIRTFIASYDGRTAGYFKLSNDGGEVEIAYFGLLPEYIGKGLGGALLTRAIEEAWRMKPRRVWVHTCNLDHDAALANYKARGMVVYKTETC